MYLILHILHVWSISAMCISSWFIKFIHKANYNCGKFNHKNNISLQLQKLYIENVTQSIIWMDWSDHNSSIHAQFSLCDQFHPWECIIHLLYFVVDLYWTFCFTHIVKFQLVNNIYFFLLNHFFACLIISFSYLTFSLSTPPCSPLPPYFPSSIPMWFLG